MTPPAKRNFEGSVDFWNPGKQEPTQRRFSQLNLKKVNMKQEDSYSLKTVETLSGRFLKDLSNRKLTM